MIPIMIFWVLGFVYIFFLGIFFLALSGRSYLKKAKENIEWYEIFWIGFVFLICILQIYSLILPIRGIFWLLSVSVISVFLVLQRKPTYELIRNTLNRIRNKQFNYWLLFSLTTILVISISYNASRDVVWYDTQMYHLNAVRWAADYPAVPGLANIDSLYGFNSSFFLYGALTDTSYFTGKASHIALSLLLIVVMFQWLYVFFDKGKTGIFEKLFCLLTFPILLHKAWANELPSLSTDLAMGLVFFVFCLEIIRKGKFKEILVLGLGAVAAVFKLSALLIALAGLFFILASNDTGNFQGFNLKDYLLRILRNKNISIPLLLFVVILSGFMARNIIVSGWLFYPFPYFGNTNLPWAAPWEQVKLSSWVIKAWARMPGVHYSLVANLTFWDWFLLWFERNRNLLEFKFGLISILAIFTVMGSKNLKSLLKGRFLSYIWLVFINLIGIVLVFFLAPDIRYAYQYFWVLVAVSLIPILVNFLKANSQMWLLLYLIVIALSFSVAGFFPRLSKKPTLFSLDAEGSKPVRALIASEGEEPPLILWVPQAGDQCGNSQIPCSTEVRNLRQRVPGDISKGFLPPN